MSKEIARIIVLAFAGIIYLNEGITQTVIPLEVLNTSSQKEDRTIVSFRNTRNKQLPRGYEQEALDALAHFPELKNVPIRFKVKKSFATLKTRPAFWSLFKSKGKRSYVITISNQTNQKLMPISFEYLPESARIGIIGHELSHVADFSKKTAWQSMKVAFGHLSRHYMDSLEFHTDKICIEHGLGNELETWSRFIRNTMHTKFWRGADFVNQADNKFERYMNPSTIEKFMADEISVQDSTTINAH